MKYKMIAIDMDGTLLTKDKKITKRTIDDVKKICSAGVLTVIATGRALQGVMMYSELRELYGICGNKNASDSAGTTEISSTPVILLNGAHIMTLPNKKTLFHQGLENETASKVMAAGHDFCTTMCIWSCGLLYGNVINDNIHRYEKLSGTEAIYAPDSDTLISRGITKFLWYDIPEKIDQMESEMRRQLGDSAAVCRTAPEFLEFFDPKVSKGSAIKTIADAYGIKKEEIIAIGDGLNDVEMLSYAGFGIAMGNAPLEVKQQADFVTKPNYEEGVAYAIEKFLISPLGLD